jgi:hypothetical protein
MNVASVEQRHGMLTPNLVGQASLPAMTRATRHVPSNSSSARPVGQACRVAD